VASRKATSKKKNKRNGPAKVNAKPKAKPKAARSPSEDDLERMVEEATVDAYDESEQATGFLSKLEDELTLPFTTVVFGAEVTVERLDITNDSRIVAVCRRDRDRHNLPLLELPLPEPPPKGWEWISAYRYWER
jgi:hypothetical protein